MLFGGDARVRAGRVDERDDRESVPPGELHDAHRLCIALRIRHPEAALGALLDVAALLLAHERNRPAVELAQSGDHRTVVGAAAGPVQLEPVVEQALDVVEGVRPLLVPRQLDGLPDLLVGRLLAHPVQLALETVELSRELGTTE